MATRLSPITEVETIASLTKDVLVAVVVAQHDAPTFKQQADAFYRALSQHDGVAPVYKVSETV